MKTNYPRLSCTWRHHILYIFYANKMCSPNWVYDAESQGKMAPHFSPIQVKKWPGKLLFDISKPIYWDISFLYTLLSSSASIEQLKYRVIYLRQWQFYLKLSN